MNKKTIYCANCDKEVNYITREETKTVKVRDRELTVTLTRAFCEECGEPVLPDLIAKKNDLIVFDEYKRLEGLLTSEEIKKIREKRKLSQRALANLINCGEKNIARYETGAIQDRVFDLLIRLVDNDTSYKVLVDRNNQLKAQQTSYKSIFGSDKKLAKQI